MPIKPILFNTEMVRAILDGRKDATRRIVKGFIPDDAVWGYTAFTPKGSYRVEVHLQMCMERNFLSCLASRAISCMSGKHGKRRRTDTITTKIGKEMTLPMLQSGNHPSTCRKKRHVSGLRLQV